MSSSVPGPASHSFWPFPTPVCESACHSVVTALCVFIRTHILNILAGYITINNYYKMNATSK